MSNALTPLERAILEAFFARHADRGFPTVDAIRLGQRIQSSAGRHVHLLSDAIVDMPDGPIGVGYYSHIEMEGLPHGMVALAYVENGRLVELELTVNGDCIWDGVERPWRIIAD